MKRPSYIQWATSRAGMYLHDVPKPTLATYAPYQIDVLNHVFPGGDEPLPYSRVIIADVKKSGKSELAAGVHIWFALFADVPAESYCVANDYDQAKSRIWRAIVGSLEKNPAIKASDWRTAGSTIEFTNGGLIRAIASDFRGEAGANISLATVDEPWGISSESAARLMTEFSPSPTRPNSTILYTGYQGWIGQSDWYHNLIDGVLLGEPVPELLHIDNGDGDPACWRNGRTFLMWNHKPRMPWHTPAYLADQRRSFKGRESEYLRVFENRRVKNADAFCTEEQWERLLDPALRALHADDPRPVVLGADAATKSDCTALAGVHWNPTTKKMEQIYIRVWQPEDGRPIKLTETIGPEIVQLHQAHKVAAVYYDPFQFAAIAEMCQKAGVKMVEFPQTARRLESDKFLHDLLWGANLAHYGDPVLKQHVTNAMTKETERGLRIVKELSSLKVDGAVALAMASLGALEVLAGGAGRDIEIVAENPFYLT